MSEQQDERQWAEQAEKEEWERDWQRCEESFEKIFGEQK